MLMGREMFAPKQESAGNISPADADAMKNLENYLAKRESEVGSQHLAEMSEKSEVKQLLDSIHGQEPRRQAIKMLEDAEAAGHAEVSDLLKDIRESSDQRKAA